MDGHTRDSRVWDFHFATTKEKFTEVGRGNRRQKVACIVPAEQPERRQEWHQVSLGRLLAAKRERVRTARASLSLQHH